MEITINPREFVANFKNNFNISVQKQYKLWNEIIKLDYFQLAYFPETWEGLLIKYEQISNSNPVVLNLHRAFSNPRTQVGAMKDNFGTVLQSGSTRSLVPSVAFADGFDVVHVNIRE